MIEVTASPAANALLILPSATSKQLVVPAGSGISSWTWMAVKSPLTAAPTQMAKRQLIEVPPDAEPTRTRGVSATMPASVTVTRVATAGCAASARF